MKPHFRIDNRFGQHLAERGLSVAEVLARARLAPGFFERDKVDATTEELFALWAAVGEISADPAIGLLLGSEDRLEHYNPISVAMLYTRSFAEALDRAARYKKLSCPEEIEILTQGDEHSARFRWLLAEREAPDCLVDLVFAWLVTIGRRGTGLGTAFSPLRVELRRPARSARVYERHFGCPVAFGAAADALVFRRADVERPFLTHNAEFLAILAPHLEAELSRQRAQQDLVEQVKGAIKRLLVGRRPDLEDVARDLCVSPRTLQRRVAAQGRTYQQLLEEARRELSRRYLLDTKLELNEAAFLLGYEDASSFFRAFRQWEGVSPGRWRKEQGSGRGEGAVA
jgi:AraC-like DNA-binding protein